MASGDNSQEEATHPLRSADGRLNLSRRQWLQITGLAGAGVLAGCSGDQSATPTGTATPTSGATPTEAEGTDVEMTATATETEVTEPTETEVTETELPTVEGQTLRTSMTANPANIVYQPARPWPGPWFDGWQGANFLNGFLHDYGIYGPWANFGSVGTGDKFHTITEEGSVSIEPTEMSWTFKKGATWANGNQITARDYLATLLHFQNILYHFKPDLFLKSVNGEEKPDVLGQWNAPLFSITGVEDDGRTVRLLSEPGWFTPGMITSEQWMWTYMSGVIHGLSGHWYDTSVEPRKTWADRAFEFWEKCKSKDITPDFPGVPTYPRESLMEGFENLGVDSSSHDAMAEWMRDPENMKTFTNGAFMVKEWNGTQSIVLEKNPEYFFADRVNFNEVEIISRPEERANWAALKADELDLYNRGTIPPNTADSFPDSIEQRLARANGGTAIQLNCHPDMPFGDVRVRQGVMQLLNTEQIADTVHRDLHRGVTVPGGHYWGAAENLPGGQAWIDENLHDYSQDRDLAAQLLRDAGWSRQSGTWHDENGEKVELTLPTTSDTPDFEVSVVQQLNNFGIDSGIATMNEENYLQQRDAGELQWGPRPNTGVGWFGINTEGQYWHGYIRGVDISKRWNVYPEEIIQNAIEEREKQNLGNRPIFALAGTGIFKIPGAPIGEWDVKEGDALEEYPMDIYLRKFGRPTETGQKALEVITWMNNWYLPILPLTNQFRHMFVDSAHYLWPDSDTWEEQGVGVGLYGPDDLIGTGRVQANPDNPE